jgi:hypothetical protein
MSKVAKATKVKVSKMAKQAMANAKLNNPATAGDYRRAWISALTDYEDGKKRQGKFKQEAATEE